MQAAAKEDANPTGSSKSPDSTQLLPRSKICMMHPIITTPLKIEAVVKIRLMAMTRDRSSSCDGTVETTSDDNPK
jgi:hypothetical protein